MLAVSVVAWLALLLAELGQFRLALLALLLTIGAFGLSLLVYAFRASPATPTAAAGWRTPALTATAGILLCAALFLPPYETAVKGGDATVYLNFGRQIAHHGALEFEDALLRPLSIASRAELFLNRVPLDTTGQFVRFPGGFLIADIADPTVTAGFSPLFPVLTALGHAVGSPRAALVVAPLFATLSLVGLWCVARRLGGVHAAWLAATLTAVSLPQIWFAKLSVPETVAQCFVMAGVLAWLVACARGATRWALAAGWFLGLACFAKVDLLVLLPVFLLAVVAARLLTRARFGDHSAPPGPARGVRPRGGPQLRALPQLRHPLSAVCRIPDPDVLSVHAAAGLRPGAGGRGPDGGVAGRGGRGGAPPARRGGGRGGAGDGPPWPRSLPTASTT